MIAAVKDEGAVLLKQRFQRCIDTISQNAHTPTAFHGLMRHWRYKKTRFAGSELQRNLPSPALDTRQCQYLFHVCFIELGLLQAHNVCKSTTGITDLSFMLKATLVVSLHVLTLLSYSPLNCISDA